jgi:transcriptional regulator with XRE-family HTH domain
VTDCKGGIALRDIALARILSPVPRKPRKPLDPNAVRVGAFIKARRESLGFDRQKDFAIELKVQQPQLSDWERGRQMPDRDNTDRLAAGLQMTVDDFLDVIKGRDQLRPSPSGKKALSRKEGAADAAPRVETRVLERRIVELEKTIEAFSGYIADVATLAQRIVEIAKKVPGRRP